MNFRDYDPGDFYDEMFLPDRTPRPGARLLIDRIEELPDGDLLRRQQAAEIALLNMGITFNVYGQEVHDEHSYAYVAGPGDEVPGLLESLGAPVRALSDEDLAYGSFEAYDTVVVGPNAYLVRDALRKAAQRLLRYVRDGGTLVVQYQGYAFQRVGAAPYAFRYNQPHDRVTNERAPVRVLDPGHFLFRFPNRVGEDDFSGWARDRGMYFFGEWDEAYTPLLCADAGEDEKRGGLLVASYGRGAYVYCGYTLFRQLAAGVPGAFRLFANLLAVPEARIRERMEHLRAVPLFATLGDEADVLGLLAQLGAVPPPPAPGG